MRKSLLAVAALMGVSVLPAKAAMFRVDENTYANIGFNSQIWAQNLGKSDNLAPTQNKARTNFSINNVKVYASGQVNQIVKFHVELDSSLGRGRDAVEGRQRIGDAHITLAFAPEFNLIAGYQRLPYGRTTLTSSYASLTPTGYAYGTVAGDAPAFGAATIGAAGVGGAGSRDAGLSVMSNIADGMIVVRAGIFDGRYDS
ncbi:MAG: porin, partial [Aquificaceae bacterium]